MLQCSDCGAKCVYFQLPRNSFITHRRTCAGYIALGITRSIERNSRILVCCRCQ